MRIGYLTYGLDRSPTGIGRYARELLHSLLKVNDEHEFFILSTENELDPGEFDPSIVHQIPACRLLPSLMSFGNFMLGRAARTLKLDLIHDPNGIAPFLSLPEKVAGVVTLHDAFPFVHPESHNRLDNWRYRWYLPAALRRASSTITVSERSRADLIDQFGLQSTSVQVIPEGVADTFRPVDPRLAENVVLRKYGVQPPYVLYLGALNGRKNIARMLEAFRIARERHPEYSLIIAGKRQWKAESIDRAMEHPDLQSSVRFTGYVADDDLPSIYSAATAFLFPSLYEGFGLPVLESMACGTPVITSRISSLPEVAGEASLLVDPYSVNETSSAIDRVLSQPGLRERLSAAGLVQASKFRWETAAIRTLEHFEQVAEERQKPLIPDRMYPTRESFNAD